MVTARCCMLTVALLAVAVCALPSRAGTLPAGLDEASAEAVYAARDKARDIVLAAAESDDAFVRANAIEAGNTLDKDRLGALVKLGLEDESSVVKFAALVSIGRLRMREQAGSARRFLDAESGSVRAAAVYALQQCGEKVELTPLAGLLADQNPTTRSNAAMLIGHMADPSAVPLLEAMSKRPMRRVGAARAALVRLQFAEAIVRLGEDDGLDALRAGMYSQFDEVRIVAIKTLGELGDRAMLPAVDEIISDERSPLEVRLAAAESAARLRRDDGLAVLLAAVKSEKDTVRVQAAAACRFFPTPKVVSAVIEMLADASPNVRVAAAATVLRLGSERR